MPTSTTTTPGESMSPVTRPGLPGRDDQDLRVSGVVAQVAGLRVEERDRAVLAQQQQRRGLADHVRPPDDDDALAGDLDAGALEDLDRGLGGRGQEAVVAEREQAGIAGVDAVDVLGRVDRSRSRFAAGCVPAAASGR